MPRYDYACPRCGFTLEVTHAMSDDTERFHACDAPYQGDEGTEGDTFVKLERRVSAVPFNFRDSRGNAVARTTRP